MRVLITGSGGQLGQALVRAAAAYPHLEVLVWARARGDISRPEIVGEIVEQSPDVVINTAAWTQVDEAESNPDGAYAVNALGPLYLAEACRACGAALVQVSTNEVFAGVPGQFYREYDVIQPGGVYARSKAAGERAATATWDQVYIVRVAWLFGRGAGDFPAKILQAAATRPLLRVVADEVGNPTYAPHAAHAILELMQTGHYGVYHLVNEGHASRFEWTEYLFTQLQQATKLEPIGLDEWPRPVSPPRHAVLVNQAAAARGIRLPHWQTGVDEYIARHCTEFKARKQQTE